MGGSDGQCTAGREIRKGRDRKKTNLKRDFYTEDAEDTEFAEKKEKARG
jgi:hypothetical protein